MHRYVINIFNRRHIFYNVFIASLLISDRQTRFVSFILPRIAHDAYVHRRENAAHSKVGNKNASRPRNDVQIDVQILVTRLSDSQTSSLPQSDMCRSALALTHKP